MTPGILTLTRIKDQTAYFEGQDYKNYVLAYEDAGKDLSELATAFIIANNNHQDLVITGFKLIQGTVQIDPNKKFKKDLVFRKYIFIPKKQEQIQKQRRDLE